VVEGVQDPVVYSEEVMAQGIKTSYLTKYSAIETLAAALLKEVESQEEVVAGLDGEWVVDKREKAIDVLQITFPKSDGSTHVYVIHLSEVAKKQSKRDPPFKLPPSLKSLLEHEKVTKYIILCHVHQLIYWLSFCFVLEPSASTCTLANIFFSILFFAWLKSYGQLAIVLFAMLGNLRWPGRSFS
jgi:hypothetical protein